MQVAREDGKIRNATVQQPPAPTPMDTMWEPRNLPCTSLSLPEVKNKA